MSALFTIVGWYAAGFLLADRLVVNGHSPVVWWTTAALLGACVAVPALLAVLWSRRTRTEPDVLAIGASSPGIHVAAIGRPEDLDSTVGAVPGVLAARMGRVSMVGTVGHEAFNPALETGERASAARAIRRVRPMARDDDRLVTTRGVDPTERAFEVVGVPDLVVSVVDDRARAARRQVAVGIETSRRCAVPVLLVAAAGDRVRSSRSSAVVA